MTTLTHLECGNCHKEYESQQLHTLCPDCGRPLLARYDLRKASKTFSPSDLSGRVDSMWRYGEVLPVVDPQYRVSLGEGFTPLIHAKTLGGSLDMPNLYIKDEGLNPTGSFKARGLCMAVSRARELGVTEVVIPSAGNAAGAMSAYAAAAGMGAHVFMPRDVPMPFQLECSVFGADVTLIDGLITDCGREAKAVAGPKGWFDVSTLKEPYRLEGKKTMGYEVAEQFNWDLPDVIVYPTGGGTGLIGMWKAFSEMEQMGWIGSKRPRMVVVQAEGCAPIPRAFEEGDRHATPWKGAQTIAAGLRVPAAVGDFLILEAVRESQGTAIAVTDQDLLAAQHEIAASEGILACPEGGATLAALRSLLKAGWAKTSDRVVLFNTGTGIKYPESLA
jgi:threonine synthase